MTKKILDTILNASYKAGEAIMEVYNSEDFGVLIKKDKSPLTLADKKAHEIIYNSLEPLKIPIISEEGKEIPYSERSEWKELWLIDPLDGTKEFIKQNDEFTVNIALIRENRAVLGAVYLPVSKELYLGIKNKGAYKGILEADKCDSSVFITQSEKLPVKTNRKVYTIVGSRSHLSEETEKFISEIKAKKGEIDFISKGSSLKMCMIAEGKADIYPRFAPTMEWDTAAGQAVATASGATLINYETKQEMLYNKKSLLNSWFIAERN